MTKSDKHFEKLLKSSNSLIGQGLRNRGVIVFVLIRFFHFILPILGRPVSSSSPAVLQLTL